MSLQRNPYEPSNEPGQSTCLWSPIVAVAIGTVIGIICVPSIVFPMIGGADTPVASVSVLLLGALVGGLFGGWISRCYSTRNF